MLSYFIPTYARFVLMIIAFYIYYHTYGKISLGIIPVLIFPSFYITYTIFKYPENSIIIDPFRYIYNVKNSKIIRIGDNITK